MRQYALPAAVAVLLLASASVSAGGRDADDGVLPYAQALAALGSPSRVVGRAALEGLLAHGPEKVEELRRIAAFLHEVMRMHDKLLGVHVGQLKGPDRHEALWLIRTDSRRATDYFAAREAVSYIELAIRNTELADWMHAGGVLSEMDPRVRREQPKAFMSAVTSLLHRVPLPNRMAEGAGHLRILQALCDAVAELGQAGLLDGAGMAGVNAEFRAALQKAVPRWGGDLQLNAQRALDALPEPAAGPGPPGASPTSAGQEVAVTAAYAEALAALGSADAAVRRGAQNGLLKLGPEKLDELRRIAGCLQEVVTMHDKLVAKPSRNPDDSEAYKQEAAAIRRDVEEARSYFAARKATRYTALAQ